MPQTLDQKRAEYAWKAVSSVAKDLSGDKHKDARKKLVSDYTNLAKSAPVLIMGSGLMQTLALLQAKGKPVKPIGEQHHLLLLADLISWLAPVLSLSIAIPQTPEETKAAFARTMDRLFGGKEADSQLYLRATDETLALLRWIRQFADARKAMES